MNDDDFTPCLNYRLTGTPSESIFSNYEILNFVARRGIERKHNTLKTVRF